MQLTLHRPGEKFTIRSVGEAGFRVGNKIYRDSIVISSTDVLPEWTPQNTDELSAEHFETIFGQEPELVLIGTGKKQIFLSPELLAEFYQRGVGVECMNTMAACRTFNVLVSEDRRVTAALMPIRTKV